MKGLFLHFIFGSGFILRARAQETPKRTPKHFVRDTNEIILVGWGQGMHYVPLPNRQEYFICTRSVGLGFMVSCGPLRARDD